MGKFPGDGSEPRTFQTSGAQLQSPAAPAPSGQIEPGLTAPVRGTQTFVHTLSWCWQHPALTGLEILWRWIFGSVALLIFYREGLRIFHIATGGTDDPGRLGLAHFTLLDPMAAAAQVADAGVILLPLLRRFADVWALPLLLLWTVVSGVGRTLVLRRADPALVPRPFTLMALQLTRAIALAGSFVLWFALMVWNGEVAVSSPIAHGVEPNLVLYFAITIVGTLALFTLWAAVSWVLAIAPLLAMLRDLPPSRSIRAALHLGPLRPKLVEINLVLGIVKIALIVLAMVFSATPLPFESVTTPTFLTGWWIGVTFLYFIGSDFFHVARLVAYLQLWRSFYPGTIAR